MAHQCNFQLDLDGQVTCSLCGAMDDDMKPDIFESQIDGHICHGKIWETPVEVIDNNMKPSIFESQIDFE